MSTGKSKSAEETTNAPTMYPSAELLQNVCYNDYC